MLELTDLHVTISTLQGADHSSSIEEFFELCDKLSLSNASPTPTSLTQPKDPETNTLSENFHMSPSKERKRLRLRADAQICQQFSSSHNFHPGRLTRNQAKELEINVNELPLS